MRDEKHFSDADLTDDEWENHPVLEGPIGSMPKCMSTYGVKFRPGCWCSCCPGSEKTWTKQEERPSHQIADGEFARIAQDGKRTYLQRAPCVQAFVHLSNRCVDESEERRMSWNPFQKRNRKSSLAREYDLGVHKMPAQLPVTPHRFEAGRNLSLGSTTNHKFVQCMFLHREQSIHAVGDHFLYLNLLVCAVGDCVLPESKKEEVGKQPEPTQPEIVVVASEETGFSKTVNACQFLRT